MRITLCGSISFIDDMNRAAQALQDFGYDVERPVPTTDRRNVPTPLEVAASRRANLIRNHFTKIDQSEAILVVNPPKKGIDGYVGANALMEMAHAFSQGLDIYMLYPVPIDVPYAEEIHGMSPIVLNGSFAALDAHVKALPLVCISSKSPVKHAAVGRGMRKAGIAVRTVGFEVESGVSAQPGTVGETYTGAQNRHRALKEMAGNYQAEYFVTIESGLHPIHEKHNVFGTTVIIVENRGGEAKVGIDMDVELPRAFTDKVPDRYPDIGALVQEEFGSTLKDPFALYTNGRLTRTQIIEDALYRLVVQSPLPRPDTARL